MCGIAGLLGLKRKFGVDELHAVASRMAESLRHRGPDDQGVWIDAEAGVAFAHTRLAIIDLSPAGAQPMVSSCGRFVLCYNGEVYNAPELRAELEVAGRKFRGHSDTEVMVEGFAVWGVQPTIERLIGMFAFAVWDRSTRTLTLARDRLGIKPLYWGHVGGSLVFASELKALRLVPGWEGEIDREALAAFLRYSYVPTPKCIYRGINKLAPGTMLECGEDGKVKHTAYWSLSEVAARGQAAPLDVADHAAQDMLESLLNDAVRRRMVADVPLGMFLSGGIDSSTVAALMQANSALPIRTFSIGFREEAYDEASHAREIAAHLGTEHTELYVTPAEAQAVIPRLPQIYDEPFADSSEIPTYLLSEMTRRHVTVALSGDGGDEVFAGYNRYVQGLALAKTGRLLPHFMRAILARAITAIPASAWDQAFLAVPKRVRPRLAGEKMHKFAAVLPRDAAGYYEGLVTQGVEADRLVIGLHESADGSSNADLHGRFADEVSWMQYCDTLGYLPDDILTKVDRASMASALEVRVPLLDHRVVELSWRLPTRFKLRRGGGKWLLRQIAYKYVPRELLERPKMGFDVPIAQWLRGPLKELGGRFVDIFRDERRLAPRPRPDRQEMGRASSRHAQLAELPLERADVRSLERIQSVARFKPSAPAGLGRARPRSAASRGFRLPGRNSAVHSSRMGTTGSMAGNFVISLDYELMWGVRDHATRESYGPNVLGGRKAIPAMLDLFQRRGIRATWATVGALLCESKDELLARAEYGTSKGAEIPRLEDIGPDERRDPYHFGASLARLIASCPGQEIGTHTFSHRCAFEPGETVASFSADVTSALVQLRAWGIRSKSIVFPRNQYGAAQLEACRALGLSHFRGNEVKWFYAPAPGKAQTKARRLCRLLDSYVDLSGSNMSQPNNQKDEPLVNVASSRFLRPFNRRLAPFDGLRIGRIEKAMQEAASGGGTFHLWWHPENFGKNLSENIAILNRVLDRFQRLRDEYGMQSRAMFEVGNRAAAEEAPHAA